MTSTYYQITHQFPKQGRWYLGDVVDASGRTVDTSVFFHARQIETGPPLRLPIVGIGRSVDVALPLRILLQRPGPPLDFTLGGFDLPVVTKVVAELLASVAGSAIQRVPTQVTGRDEMYEIVNIVNQ